MKDIFSGAAGVLERTGNRKCLGSCIDAFAGLWQDLCQRAKWSYGILGNERR